MSLPPNSQTRKISEWIGRQWVWSFVVGKIVIVFAFSASCPICHISIQSVVYPSTSLSCCPRRRVQKAQYVVYLAWPVLFFINSILTIVVKSLFVWRACNIFSLCHLFGNSNCCDVIYFWCYQRWWKAWGEMLKLIFSIRKSAYEFSCYPRHRSQELSKF